MIPIVNKTNKYKYLVGLLFLIFSIVLIIFLNQKEKNIYILYETNFSECNNVNDYYIKEYYVLCNKKKTILFKKQENKKIENKKIERLQSLNLISKKRLFEEFEDSIIYGNIKDFPEYSKYNIFLVKIIKDENLINIIPVKQVKILS